MGIEEYLQLMVERQASDLFFSSGAPVHIKIHGDIQPVDKLSLSPDDVKAFAYSILSDEQKREFEQTLELNLAYTLIDYGRYRINLYRQRGSVAMVVRHIKNVIPSIEELHMPPTLNDLVLEPRGLVLMVGATGSGKSTTLASMIDFRNRNRTGHILTVEDPIEFLHKHNKSIVDQREIGLDTLSYSSALKNAMREAPDVILIGEIRDRETMQQAIAYADTGHLCLSTLHANNASQTIDRIINLFPESAHNQLLVDLSVNLKAVVSQRLVPRISGGRIPAAEVLLRTPYVSDLIRKREIGLLRDAMEKNVDIGMQTFDYSLYQLVAAGEITESTALDNAESRNNLALKLRLERTGQSYSANNKLGIGDKE